MLDTTRLDRRPGIPRDAANDNRVGSGFAELVYADPAWLDAEFDAIMTANFGSLGPSPYLPPRSPHSWPGSPGPRRGRYTSVGAGDWRVKSVRSGRSGGRRERSPPQSGAPDGPRTLWRQGE